MTHIFPEIRIDAVRVLDLLLELFPRQVSGSVLSDQADGGGQNHGRKLLDGYLNLLSVNSRLYEEDQRKASSSSAMIGQTISMVTLSITVCSFRSCQRKSYADNELVENNHFDVFREVPHERGLIGRANRRIYP